MRRMLSGFRLASALLSGRDLAVTDDRIDSLLGSILGPSLKEPE